MKNKFFKLNLLQLKSLSKLGLNVKQVYYSKTIKNKTYDLEDVIKEVNKQFYGYIASHFTELVDALEKNGKNPDDAKQFSEWKYAKFGFTKQGVVLFTSSSDINNFTELPDKFENEYFYTPKSI